MFLLKLHIIQGEFGPEKAERSCLRLFPTQSCHARCWPVVCSSTPGAFEYCTGLGWMSPRPFCRCACQNGTEFRWTTCCARAPEMGAACCTRGQHAAPKPIEALASRREYWMRGFLISHCPVLLRFLSEETDPDHEEPTARIPTRFPYCGFAIIPSLWHGGRSCKC